MAQLTHPADGASQPPPRIVLSIHYWALGPAVALKNYLQSRTDRLLFIAHPLIAGDGTSYVELYETGKQARAASRPSPRGLGRYLEELRLTIKWTSQQGESDAFIAGDSLLALAGLWLRSRGRVRSVILYTVDYVPRRFANGLINRIYHRVDAFSVRRVNIVWNVTKEIELARASRDGGRPTAPQIVVPVGANVDGIVSSSTRRPTGHGVAFLGHLLEKQGVQLVIAALAQVRQEVPDATLLVVGDGPYAATLQGLVRERGATAWVQFAGVIYDESRIRELLTSAAIAVAPYVPSAASFTRFADPGKIKTYLACGLPVLVTDVPPIARIIDRSGAGRVVPYDVDAFARTIIEYLTNPSLLEKARLAALELAQEFSWNRVFDDAWRLTTPLLG